MLVSQSVTHETPPSRFHVPLQCTHVPQMQKHHLFRIPPASLLPAVTPTPTVPVAEDLHPATITEEDATTTSTPSRATTTATPAPAAATATPATPVKTPDEVYAQSYCDPTKMARDLACEAIFG